MFLRGPEHLYQISNPIVFLWRMPDSVRRRAVFGCWGTLFMSFVGFRSPLRQERFTLSF